MTAFSAVPVGETKEAVIAAIFEAIHRFEDGRSDQQLLYLDEHFPSRILEKDAVDIGFLKVSPTNIALAAQFTGLSLGSKFKTANCRTLKASCV